MLEINLQKILDTTFIKLLINNATIQWSVISGQLLVAGCQ